jgi:hypothetical protein
VTSKRRQKLSIQVGGDLLVVVIGVLIALWVNNFNESRKENIQENAYLSGILVDLRSDSTDLANRSATAIRGLEVADNLLELRRATGSTAPADSLVEWFLHAAFIDNFQVLDHTYRELLGSGGLSLIRDDALRRQISGYYRSIESAEFFTEYYKGEETDYWDLLAERLDPADFEGITRSEDKTVLPSPNRLINSLRTDDEIANSILMNRHWTELRLSITERRRTGNSALATVIRGRLSN